MIKWLQHSMVRSFERKANYDASYMHDVVEISSDAAWRLSMLPLLSQYRGDAPAALWLGAGLASVLEGDCGPCVQLMVDAGLALNVTPDVIKALLQEDFDAAGYEAALGYRFALAAINDLPALDALRDEIVAGFGEKAWVACSYAAATARVYPVLKRGLGHGKTCQQVKIGPDMVAPHGKLKQVA